MVHFIGGYPRSTFTYGGRPLERVNNFKYLGVWFSTQLGFTEHVKQTVNRAQARVGFLFHRLEMSLLPIQTVLKIFQIYVLPLVEYALPIWLSSSCINSSRDMLNALFAKFLKRYLGVPSPASSKQVHHLCQTRPLYEVLWSRREEAFHTLAFPRVLDGRQLSFLREPNPPQFPSETFQLIPSTFWRSRVCHNIPWNPLYRRQIFREILDTDHHVTCSQTKFHRFPDNNCICIVCNTPNHHFHSLYFCDI